METRAIDVDKELYQDPEIDQDLFSSEIVFDNAGDDLDMIAISKRSRSLLPQEEAVRIDLEPFEQETKQLEKLWRFKTEDDAHQPLDS